MNRGRPLPQFLMAGLALFALLLPSCRSEATATPSPSPSPSPTPAPTPTPTPALTPTATAVAISFDPALTRQARQLFTEKYVCNVCHSIASLNMMGGVVGPDLSGALLGRVPLDTPPELNPVKRWLEEKGLARPELDPAKAGELLSAFLASPPAYAPTKMVQVAAFKGLAGGDKPWMEDVKALVELLKEAAAKQ